MKVKNNPRGIFSNLRANVTENRVKFKFGGRSRKIDFSQFSSTYRPEVDMKCDIVFSACNALDSRKSRKTNFAPTMAKLVERKGGKLEI